jgi:hypothetical protein
MPLCDISISSIIAASIASMALSLSLSLIKPPNPAAAASVGVIRESPDPPLA